ncbi:hypothetical protein ACWGQ5_51340 [Streptomyces sp. NPDC055722]
MRSGLDSAFGSRLIATVLSLQALTNAWITAGTSLEAIAESCGTWSTSNSAF